MIVVHIIIMWQHRYFTRQVVNTASVSTITSKHLFGCHYYCDMMSESRNSSLLGDGSVNNFLRKRTHATIEERLTNAIAYIFKVINSYMVTRPYIV
jgi:hypothetical protein